MKLINDTRRSHDIYGMRPSGIEAGEVLAVFSLKKLRYVAGRMRHGNNKMSS